MPEPIRIGALISGSGTNLEAILIACEKGKINGNIVFVGTDNPEAAGLKRARQRSIPTFVTDYKKIIRSFQENHKSPKLPSDFDIDEIYAKQNLFPPGTDNSRITTFLQSRAVAEADLLENMKPYQFDLLVLAGFMRTLTPYFIDRVNTDPSDPRIMNIHPALLPAFPGVDGYGDTFRYGCKVGGCTVHFIDYGEDSGPIIGQKAFEIREEDTLETIRQKGLELEWQLYPECIARFAEGRLYTVVKTHTLNDGRIYKRRVVMVAKSPHDAHHQGQGRKSPNSTSEV